MGGSGVLLIDQKVNWYRWRVSILIVQEQLQREYAWNSYDHTTYHVTLYHFFNDRDMYNMQTWKEYYNHEYDQSDLGGLVDQSIYHFGKFVCELPKYYLYSNGDYTKNMNF